MADVGKRIKAIRSEKGVKRAQAAKEAGISYDYLAKIENGRRSPNLDVLGAIARAIGASLPEIIAAPPPAPVQGIVSLGEGKPVPRIGWAFAGQWGEASDSGFEPGQADEWVYSERGGGSVFALTVEGDSMAPEFTAGEVILVNPDVEPKSGDFVIAKLEDENEATFKQLVKRRGKMALHPLNPKYPDIPLDAGKKCRIVGVVVEKKTFFNEPDERAQKLAAIRSRIEKLPLAQLDKLEKTIDIFFGK